MSFLLRFKGEDGQYKRFDNLEQVVDAVDDALYAHKLRKAPSWDDLFQLFRSLCAQPYALGRAVPTVPNSYRWSAVGLRVEAAHYRPLSTASSRLVVHIYRDNVSNASYGRTRVTVLAYTDPIPVLYFIEPYAARRRLHRELAKLEAVCPGAAALLEPHIPVILERGLRPAHILDENGSFALIRLPGRASAPAVKALGTPVGWFDVSRARGNRVRSVLRAVLQGRLPVSNRGQLPWNDYLAGVLLLTLPRLKPL